MALGSGYLLSVIAAAVAVGFVFGGLVPDPWQPAAPDASDGDPPTPARQDEKTDPLVPVGFDVRTPPDLSREPPFALEEGTLPDLQQAKSFTRKYSRFIAKGDVGIEKLRAEGHLKGEGTPEDPYVLERFYVEGELSLTSLHKSIVLREGYVAGQLRLNYIGDPVYVHHVYAKDLRVNENVARNGTNTGGLFHDNHFAFVGQIRHFAGEFRENRVGPRPADVVRDAVGDSGLVRIPEGVVFNLDGFHGANVHHNEFIGQVDIKLHGHNHGDCFTCPAHDHSDTAEFPGHHHDHSAAKPELGFHSRHSVRYASLSFHDNVIRVPSGIALRYNDLNHAGDDRTAKSEPNQRLDDPHIHFQDVTFQGNRLEGGRLLVDVFNAVDPRHPVQNRGILRVWGSEIRVDYEPPSMVGGARLHQGILLRNADGLELSLRDNEIRFRELVAANPVDAFLRSAAPKVELRGIQLEAVEDSNLTLAQNLVATGRFGVFAKSLDAQTHWLLRQNGFLTDEPWRGQDVANPPKEE